jgi:hypothetical protein
MSGGGTKQVRMSKGRVFTSVLLMFFIYSVSPKRHGFTHTHAHTHTHTHNLCIYIYRHIHKIPGHLSPFKEGLNLSCQSLSYGHPAPLPLGFLVHQSSKTVFSFELSYQSFSFSFESFEA